MSELGQFQSDKKLLTPQNRLWVNNYLQLGANYPITLEIDPTNNCPLSCPNCIWGDFRASARDSIKPEVLLRIIGEAQEIGVRSLVWTGGGEPLAHRTTLQGMKKASELGLKNGLFTTAFPMSAAVSDVLLENLTWVRFHLDGATPDSYGFLHQVNPDVFEKVTNNICYFVQRRKELGLKTSAGMNTIASKETLPEVSGLARLAKDMGLDFFQFKHDLTQTNQPEHHQWWKDEVVPIMDELNKELSDDYFRLQYVRQIDISEPDTAPLCHIHHALTAITADGRVAYCKSTRDQIEWSLGSIYDNHLRDIFNGERHQYLKKCITPNNCGIIPCANKAANLIVDQVVRMGCLDILGTEYSFVEHQDFI